MPNIPSLFKYNPTPVLSTSVQRFKQGIAFSTGHFSGSQVYFLSFCRNTYNWPEEIDVAGDIVAGQWGHNYQRNW